MHRETKRTCFIFVALILACFVVGCITAAAQQATTAKEQTSASATQEQSVAQDQQASQSAEPQPEVAPKASYFGPAKFAWDTTVKYSNMFRLASRSDALVSPILNPNNVNGDDGDNNFHGGLVSNRLDFLTEMDLSFGSNFGFRGSAAAWYDPTYNQRTANNSPFTYNSYSSIDNKHFAAGTKDLQYLQAELLDAFVHFNVPVGKANIAFRGGQFTQTWGQTLFFGGNGIAGAMAPVDLVKALSVPNVQFKELMRPVPQVAMVLHLNSRISLGGYYQLMWKPTRMMSSGSYFSTGDVFGDGAERFAFGPNTWLHRRADVEAKNAGQFGVELLASAPRGWDLGFYFAQFHEKTPQIYLAPQICFGPPNDPVKCPFNLDPASFNPMIGEFGSFGHVYHTNIKTIGMSASKTVGFVNYAAEVSGRWNQDLTGALPVVFAPPAFWANNQHAIYPIGKTFHANVSALATLPPNAISKEASLVAEFAFNRLLGVDKNNDWWTVPSVSGECGTTQSVSQTNAAICNSATDSAGVLQVVYTPTYRQALPGLDLSVPVGLQISPFGRSVLGPGFNTYHGGFFNIGASLAFRDANRFSVTYQRFIGPQIGAVDQNTLLSYGQAFGDRNYITFSIYRTFGVRAKQKAQ